MEDKERIQILQDLVKINSVNGNEIEVSKYLQALFRKHGIDAKVDAFGDKRANLVTEVGQKQDPRVLAFEGHQDTVAVPDPTVWSHDPFGGEIVGDKLYGRGSADMKSGLASQVIALIELKDADKLPKGTVRFIATAGEEYGTPGAYRLDKQGITKDISAMVVGEPTAGQVVYAHAGSLNYKIESRGKSAHSSRPETGINAISGLVAYINAEKNLFDDVPTDPLVGDVKHSVTIIKGGAQVNTIPDTAELYGNIRPTKSFDNPKVIKRIKGEVDKINANTDYDLKFELIHNFYPVGTPKDNPLVQLVQKIATENYHDRKIELKTINGATDASVYIQSAPNMPVVIFGCDAWKMAHQVDEYTTLTSFRATIESYKALALRYFE